MPEALKTDPTTNPLRIDLDRLKALSSPLEAALCYASMGWPVFPVHTAAPDPKGGPATCSCYRKTQCAHKGKHPITEHGHNDATTDPDLIQSWWEQWPWANVAIATGPQSGVLVLDVDPRNGGMIPFQEIKDQIPATLEAATGGGGFHRYYLAPSKKPGSSPWEGIDIKGDGGYVLAPPSQHESGQVYRWKSGTEIAPSDTLIALLPEPKTEPKPKKKTNGKSTLGGTKKEKAYAERALEHAVAHVQLAQEGERNNVLNREAFGLGGFLTKDLLDQAIVHKRLFDAAVTCGLPEDEAARTLERSLQQGISKPRDVRQEIKKPIKKPVEGLSLDLTTNELDIARAALETYDNLVYDETFQDFYLYGPERGTWERQTEGSIAKRIMTFHGAAALSAKDKIVELKVTANMVRNVTTLMKAIAEQTAFLDSAPYVGLPFRNGVFSLEAGLQPHCPENRIQSALSFDYVTDATCPRWENVLSEILPDPSLRMLLQEVFGAALFRLATRYEKAFILYGRGGNGKSLTCQILRGLLPADAVAAIAPHSFSKPFHVAELKNAWVNIVTEIRQGELRESETLKAFISGDLITAEEKYKRPFKFTARCTNVFACNILPLVTDHTEGLWRKIDTIPYEIKVPKARKDVQLAGKLLKAEREGIAQWAIQGARRLLDNDGFTRSERSEEVTLEWRLGSDQIAQFVREYCVSLPSDSSPKNWITATELFGAYKQWADMRNFSKLNATNFGLRLSNIGIAKKKSYGVNRWALQIKIQQ